MKASYVSHISAVQSSRAALVPAVYRAKAYSLRYIWGSEQHAFRELPGRRLNITSLFFASASHQVVFVGIVIASSNLYK